MLAHYAGFSGWPDLLSGGEGTNAGSASIKIAPNRDRGTQRPGFLNLGAGGLPFAAGGGVTLPLPLPGLAPSTPGSLVGNGGPGGPGGSGPTGGNEGSGGGGEPGGPGPGTGGPGGPEGPGTPVNPPAGGEQPPPGPAPGGNQPPPPPTKPGEAGGDDGADDGADDGDCNEAKATTQQSSASWDQSSEQQEISITSAASSEWAPEDSDPPPPPVEPQYDEQHAEDPVDPVGIEKPEPAADLETPDTTTGQEPSI